MKIEDVKIGMKVVYDGDIYTVENVFKSWVYITDETNGGVTFPEEIEEVVQKHKRIPLSEMPQEEFDELLKLGYEVEYKRCCDGVKTVNGITMVTDDNWKTTKLCLGGNK